MSIAPKTDAEKAQAIAEAAADLASGLTRTSNTYSTRNEFRLLKLCNAIIALIDDGNCLAQRETIMEEYGWDEDGNPVPPEGDLCAMPSGYALRAALNPIACNGGL